MRINGKEIGETPFTWTVECCGRSLVTGSASSWGAAFFDGCTARNKLGNRCDLDVKVSGASKVNELDAICRFLGI